MSSKRKTNTTSPVHVTVEDKSEPHNDPDKVERINEVLTEHLGYHPLGVIDDVINAVNALLYKCTEAMEHYLKEMKAAKDNEIQSLMDDDGLILSNISENIYTEEEIARGTAELETLLENKVDRSFDKLELYALRNILTLPYDLLDEGYIRLLHQQGIDYGPYDQKQLNEFDNHLKLLKQDIEVELQIRKVLVAQIKRAKKVVKALRQLRQVISAYNDANRSYHKQPMNENIVELFNFMIAEVKDLGEKATAFYKLILSRDATQGGIKGLEFMPDSRDLYTDLKSFLVVSKDIAISSHAFIEHPTNNKAHNTSDGASTQLPGNLMPDEAALKEVLQMLTTYNE
ncbi:uncharacterized protein KQ657_000633 [Scheffersomyces spartinae]|uniref:Uncharacterized protein n=1 Tax=Scheffersomyces spartinae TaxID=45513 RepID=A0A9P7V994_9ASCO|nr:uncharacterized protein KQ657_000633 [Scheffersomyces spartinae]KAG7193564.1 hypothetical protein KQ657_000633 [Scheffersomyces spartinae]